MLSDGIALQSKAVAAPGDESIIAEGASKSGNTGGSGKHSGQRVVAREEMVHSWAKIATNSRSSSCQIVKWRTQWKYQFPSSKD